MIARSLDDALAVITDGCVLAVPREVSGVAMAATRALVRRGIRRLHLIALPTSSLPAIKPDVALFHAPLADRDGNIWIGRDRELATMAHAAAKTVVTVEKLHDGNLFDDPALAAGALGGFYVHAIAVAPKGAWPLGLAGHYGADTAHLADYARMAASSDGFAAYLDRHVYAQRAA